MKLLAVAESLAPRGGWGAYSAGLLRALVNLGIRPTVLLDRRSQADGPDGIDVIPCLSSPLGALVRPQAMAWNAAQFLRHARGTDLLHFMVEPYVTASVMAGLPPGCITLHGTYAISPFREGLLTRTLYSAALRRARAVICVSSFTRGAVSSKLKLENLQVIHNGHDLLRDEDAAEREKVVVDGRPVILGVGALKPRKGYHVSLGAIARLRERYPELRYYMVGNDADRKYVARLRSEITELGLQHQAVITGPVSEGRLRALYRQADLFLLTPVNVGSSFEGFGIAYLEASAFGKPIVGSLGCGAEEAVEHGVTGLLVPQNDEETTAQQVATILDDPALAERLGEAGRGRAQAQTWTAVARQYVDVYEQSIRR